MLFTGIRTNSTSSKMDSYLYSVYYLTASKLIVS